MAAMTSGENRQFFKIIKILYLFKNGPLDIMGGANVSVDEFLFSAIYLHVFFSTL